MVEHINQIISFESKEKKKKKREEEGNQELHNIKL